MSINFNAKDLANNNKSELKKEVNILQGQGITPHLDVILIGNNNSAIIYAEKKKKIAENLGIELIINSFPENVEEKEIENLIKNINNNSKKHGIILESPVPKNINYERLISLIFPQKDVDGLNSYNLGKIMNKDINGIIPATPLACINILENLVESIKGLNIVIVGRGRTVGLPLSVLLINMGATVTSCNSQTKDLKKNCLGADVIISATGIPKLITKDMINENTIVIDAGISVDSEGKIIGDVDYKNVSKIAKYVTPVPGGVGPVTTSIIFKNLIKGIKLQQNKDPFNISLDDFIHIAKGPGMPGGGGISSITAINGISMISMVFSLTKNIDTNIYKLKTDSIISILKQKYIQDMVIFQNYLNALKMPKETNEEKEKRSKIIQESLMQTCEIPLEISEICLNILNIAQDCYKIGNPNVLTDVLVGINLTKAAAKSALEPIESNLKSIKDNHYVENTISRKNKILAEIDKFII